MEPFDKNYFRTKEIQSTIDLDRNNEVFKEEKHSEIKYN